ncbi:MAG: 16S rRNA (cytosine(967)-C(5))-methyltransferase RsmB [Chloracidobacterium sp.]|nr:16S rRNA (cytosine(967)-C(5))-methyltransferase RsmB [Chloracidobacterium sp.]
MKISPARIAAFDVLLKIETKGAFSSILLPEYEARLGQKDSALCHELTLGVLRNQIHLDAIIDHYSKGRKLDEEIRIAIRLGLFQLIFLSRIPPHSAVNESVNLALRARRKYARGLVNAILRQFVREPFRPDADDELERISLETSHPRWLVEKWAADFGIQETRHLTSTNNVQPRIAFRLTNKGADVLGSEHIQRSDISKNGLVTERMTSDLITAAARGDIYFQDEGSQLVGDTVELDDGAKFLDLCAAPGSKFSQIALANHGKNCLLVAGDLRAVRLSSLRKICISQGVESRNVVQFDAVKALPFAAGSLDSVLVDAPCSGTGTIRHNPEIRYRLTPSDLPELALKQRSILANASKLVKSGGRLIYSTCSLEKEENEHVVRWFLSESEDFRLDATPLPERFVASDKCVRLVPHKHGTDGFFIACLVRN